MSENHAVVGTSGVEVGHVDRMFGIVTIRLVVAPQRTEVEFAVGIVFIDEDVRQLLVASKDFAGNIPVDE